MQSRLSSFVESLVNVAVGMVIALIVQALLYASMGIEVTHSQNFVIVTVLTIVSVARSYLLRRAFNWWHHKRGRNAEQSGT